MTNRSFHQAIIRGSRGGREGFKTVVEKPYNRRSSVVGRGESDQCLKRAAENYGENPGRRWQFREEREKHHCQLEIGDKESRIVAENQNKSGDGTQGRMQLTSPYGRYWGERGD